MTMASIRISSSWHSCVMMCMILMIATTSQQALAFGPSVLPRTQQHHVIRSSQQHSSSSSLYALTEAWDAYNQALEMHPLIVKSVTASVILGAADVAGQALENRQQEDDDDENKNQLDLGRTLRFAIFGLVLQAPWNHYYYLLLDGWLPPTQDPWTATTAIKTVLDQFVQAPIFTVLIFAFLGLLEGKTVDKIQNQLQDDYADTMVANWKLWVPATVVNLAFVPPILRVLYLNVVFFFWSIFLSIKINNKGGDAGEEQATT